MIKLLGKLLPRAICSMFCHSSWRCSCGMRRVNILLMRNRQAASLCSGRWLERMFMVVSVVVGFRYILMSRWEDFLVIVRSRKLTLCLFS